MPGLKQASGTKQRPLGWLWVSLAWVLGPAAFLGLFHLCKGNKALMNFLVRYITSPIKHGISWVGGFLPIALSEVICAAAVVGIGAFLVRSVYLLVHRKGRAKRLLRRALAAVSIFLMIYSGYTAMWGINYYADTFCEQAGLVDRGTNAEELYTLLVAFADRASELAGQVQRDETGQYTQDLNLLFSQAQDVYDGIVEQFPCLAGVRRQPRPLVSSRLVSYLNFTGFFFPFTGESMINVDQPEYLVPVTMLHEISHQRNVASEEECNFIAILAGVESGNVDFAYSACMEAYIYLSNALRKADAELWADAVTHLSDTAKVDNAANNAYWAQFATPVQTAAKNTYSSFIKSYGQTDGLASYGKCVDLLASYYFDYAPDGRFWE